MSFGLILLIFGTINPSTTYKGALPPKAVPIPRTKTVGVPPGVSVLIILTPANLPCKDCMAVVLAICVMSLALADETADVRSDFLTVPYPTTTA